MDLHLLKNHAFCDLKGHALRKIFWTVQAIEHHSAITTVTSFKVSLDLVWFDSILVCSFKTENAENTTSLSERSLIGIVLRYIAAQSWPASILFSGDYLFLSVIFTNEFSVPFLLWKHSNHRKQKHLWHFKKLFLFKTSIFTEKSDNGKKPNQPTKYACPFILLYITNLCDAVKKKIAFVKA